MELNGKFTGLIIPGEIVHNTNWTWAWVNSSNYLDNVERRVILAHRYSNSDLFAISTLCSRYNVYQELAYRLIDFSKTVVIYIVICWWELSQCYRKVYSAIFNSFLSMMHMFVKSINKEIFWFPVTTKKRWNVYDYCMKNSLVRQISVPCDKVWCVSDSRGNS